MNKGVHNPFPLIAQEHDYKRSFKASFWNKGVEDPCIIHHVFGSTQLNQMNQSYPHKMKI